MSVAKATKSAGAPRSTTKFTVDGVPCFCETQGGLPLVTIQIAFRTGAALDPASKDGLSRFMFRLLRRGAGKYDANGFEEAVDSIGGELSLDASTSALVVSAQGIKRNIRALAGLLHTAIAEPRFGEADVGRLSRETVAEIEDGRDSDRALASVALRRSLFGEGHPYSRGATGRISTVKTFTRDDVLAIYATHVTRKNVVLGFAGDVTEDEAKGLAAQILEGLPDTPAPNPNIPAPDFGDGRRLVFVDKPERTQTQILIGMSGTHPADDDHVALSAATSIFGGTFTSRLVKEVRSKRGWSYGASARLSIERARQGLVLWTFPAAKDAAPCVELELALLDTWVKSGVTDRETSFIKRYLSRSHAFDIDTASKRMQQALDTELLSLPDDYYSSYLEHVSGVTAEASSNAVKTRVNPANVVIAVVGTASEILADVTKKIPDLKDVVVVPHDAD